MHSFNLVALLPLLNSLVDYFSPSPGIGDAHLIGQLPFMPGPFPSKTYSGFIDISSEKSIHYAFTESESSPQTDPLIIWYSGGPGCSSMLGLFTEIGPFILKEEATEFVRNQYAWSKKANVMYIDQPAGTGYSIGRTAQSLHSSDTQSTKDNLAVLLQFFKMYPRFKSNEVYITGESYTGIYGPLIAEAIDQHNTRLPLNPINLKGVILGNPEIKNNIYPDDFLRDSFGRAMMPPLLKKQYEENSCAKASADALEECYEVKVKETYALHFINKYDVYRKCYYDETVDRSLWPRKGPHLPCLYVGPLQDMLSDSQFKRAFNVEGAPHWQRCSDTLDYHEDIMSVIPSYEKLRHRYKLMIFEGDTDEILGYGYVMRGLRQFGWETKEEFSQWYQEGEMVGYKWVLDGMTFATIHGVGHMAAAWRPREVQRMVYDFIEGSF